MIIFATVASLFVGTTSNISAVEANDLDAKGAIVVEQKTGKILFDKNPDEVFGIASMSKMATQYLVNEAVQNGEVSWDTKITVSQRAVDTSANYELSNVPLRVGEEYTIQELYEAMSIYSANAATIALAEYLGGSEDAWVAKIQEKLQSWGITDATFINASGLPNQYGLSNRKENLPADAENSMSARSVAILARHLAEDFPSALEVAATTEKVFHPGTVDETVMKNYNLLLPGLLFGRAGVTGLKTGTTDGSGASLTATATENGMSVVAVIIGSSQPLKRFEEMNKLLTQVFAQCEVLTLASKGESAKGIKPYATNGSDEVVSIDYGKDFLVVVPKGTAKSQVVLEFQPEKNQLDEYGKLKAPFKKGDVIGRIYYTVERDIDKGYLEKTEGTFVPAVAGIDVGEANIFQNIWRSITRFFGNLF